MRNRFNLSESEKNYIRGLHGINVITEQEEEGYVGGGCTEDQLALGMEPIPGGGCECPPGTEEDETGNCVDAGNEEGEVSPEQEEQEDKDVVDEELTDEEVAAVVDPEKEETWLAERWEDLTDAVRNIFSRNKKFFGCRGKGACPSFNKMSRRRKRRMISRITIQWPKIRFRLPWRVKNVFSEWKRKRARKRFKRQHKFG